MEETKDEIPLIRVRLGRGGRVAKWGVKCPCGFQLEGLANKAEGSRQALAHAEAGHDRDARISVPS